MVQIRLVQAAASILLYSNCITVYIDVQCIALHSISQSSSPFCMCVLAQSGLTQELHCKAAQMDTSDSKAYMEPDTVISLLNSE